MKACIAAEDVSGAVSCFSIATQDNYQRAFSSMSKTQLDSFVKGLGPIKKVTAEVNKAQYCFENVVDGKVITFPVDFDMENGEWKIVEF